MKKATLLMFAAALFAAATAHAAVPEVLTYRGQLTRTGGFSAGGENLTLTFKIYDSEAPGTVLWGRSVVTAVDTNGVFYAELKDDNGAAVQGASYAALVDAVAAAKGAIEVGLTPPGAGEISPRQTLTTGVRAAAARQFGHRHERRGAAPACLLPRAGRGAVCRRRQGHGDDQGAFARPLGLALCAGFERVLHDLRRVVRHGADL